MQQVRLMMPVYNSGLCISTLSCDQVYVILILLDKESNHLGFCLFFPCGKTRTGFQKSFLASIIRLTKPIASHASHLVYQLLFTAKPVGYRLEELNNSIIRINVFVLV